MSPISLLNVPSLGMDYSHVGNKAFPRWEYASSPVVTITDDGQPFNPTTVPDPDLSVPGEKRKAGGLGTMLMRKMCDRIAYRREEHQNVLEMYGTISSESLANSPDTISL